MKEKKERPDFVKKLEEKWVKWTGVESDTIGEALVDLSGNLYHELRKLESILLTEVERRGIPDDFKDFVKEARTEAWKGILSKQKVGMDKMCIIVRQYVEENRNDKTQK